MDDFSRFCRLNSECPEYGERRAGNLSVTSRYGPEKARRMLRCRACKVRFSERKGTPLLDSRLPSKESRIGPGAHRRGVRRPTDRSALQGRSRRGRPLQTDRWRSFPRPSRRVGRDFPPSRARPNSMRSGPSSPRRRRIATGPARPMTAREIPGIISRSMPRVGR